MLFSDLTFIFRALPLFLIIFYIVPYKLRTPVLIAAGLLFYGVNAPRYLPVLIAAILITYAFSAPVSSHNKPAYICSVTLDVLALFAFKTAATYLPAIRVTDDITVRIILPLGMSFYIFKLISYQTDLYTGRIRRAALADLSVYILDFTQITSGPISRYAYSLDNPNRIIVSSENVRSRLCNAASHICDGLTYFAAGLFIKIIIADHLAILWRELGTIGYESISTPLAWLGVLIYSMTLFYDFWGYSLMAAGLGVMIGFKFIRNFKNPYAASSVSDFYRRWHITLGEWFRDYVYIPLGGNRRSRGRTALNLCAVWLLTGIWHGISVNFLIWAGLLLLLILSEKYILSRSEVLLNIVGKIHVLLIIPLTWVIFALTDIKDLCSYFGALIGLHASAAVINASDYASVLSEGWMYIVLGLICLLPGVRRSFMHHRYSPVWTILLFIMFWLSIYSSYAAPTNPFMYMAF